MNTYAQCKRDMKALIQWFKGHPSPYWTDERRMLARQARMVWEKLQRYRADEKLAELAKKRADELARNHTEN